MKLLSQTIPDALVRELIETTRYHDPVTGEPYEPATLPRGLRPEGDDDAR